MRTLAFSDHETFDYPVACEPSHFAAAVPAVHCCIHYLMLRLSQYALLIAMSIISTQIMCPCACVCDLHHSSVPMQTQLLTLYCTLETLTEPPPEKP